MKLLLGVCVLGSAKEILTGQESGKEGESQQDAPFAVTRTIARCLDCCGPQAIEKRRCDEGHEQRLDCAMHSAYLIGAKAYQDMSQPPRWVQKLTRFRQSHRHVRHSVNTGTCKFCGPESQNSRERR